MGTFVFKRLTLCIAGAGDKRRVGISITLLVHELCIQRVVVGAVRYFV